MYLYNNSPESHSKFKHPCNTTIKKTSKNLSQTTVNPRFHQPHRPSGAKLNTNARPFTGTFTKRVRRKTHNSVSENATERKTHKAQRGQKKGFSGNSAAPWGRSEAGVFERRAKKAGKWVASPTRCT